MYPEQYGDTKVYRLDDTYRYQVEAYRLEEMKWDAKSWHDYTPELVQPQVDRYDILTFGGYHATLPEYAEQAAQDYVNKLVKNSKTIYVAPVKIEKDSDPRYGDRYAWTVRAGGPEIQFWAKVFSGDYREVDRLTQRVIHDRIEPKTLRECFRYALKIVKGWFRGVLRSP